MHTSYFDHGKEEGSNKRHSSSGPMMMRALIIFTIVCAFAESFRNFGKGKVEKFDIWQSFLLVGPPNVHPPTGSSASESSTHLMIGYAISVTKCQPTDISMDQAAILRFSIHRNSKRSGNSDYDYTSYNKAYAFVHPEAAKQLYQDILA